MSGRILSSACILTIVLLSDGRIVLLQTTVVVDTSLVHTDIQFKYNVHTATCVSWVPRLTLVNLEAN